MANATLTMNVDELADAIAAKVSKVDPAKHEAVTAERDKLRGELNKIGWQAMPARFHDEHGATFEAARAFYDHYIEQSRSAEVVADKLEAVTGERDEARANLARAVGDVTTLRQSVSTLSDQAIELRGDLKTVTDERDEYLRQLDEARAEIAAGKAASAHGFEPGEKVKAIGDGGYGPVGIAAGDVLTVRGTADGVIDDDGDLRVFNSRGGQNWIRPSNVRKLRTYKAGDPEPEDKTVTLTGEFEGRTVTLKHGRLSELQDGGGPLTWWDVSGKWPTNAVLSGGFGYWAAKYGPLTEV
ncbi:hypothetical protein KDJ61_gp59 [Gordonia phage TZGordon]|uniref:Rhodanese domain-containing protein n=1 Tax=Gordonia phage TZGordon TaxID=2744004 RepID=A0A6N0A596_9CAUD|nr:hypothetical protein KDJ61_gp59 [Gordonia phage TZGordon]QKO02976.1 hypothetical protein SEA_TZGORDON_57 [Gordonia phage TZGordon]